MYGLIHQPGRDGGKHETDGLGTAAIASSKAANQNDTTGQNVRDTQDGETQRQYQRTDRRIWTLMETNGQETATERGLGCDEG